MPFLAVGKDEVFLSWFEKGRDGGHTLKFSKWAGEKWSASKVIASGKSFFVNWADFPSILTMSDGSLVAHWLAMSGKGTYDYDVMISRSTDGGNSWGNPVRPHRDGKMTEHGFVSLIDRGAGNFSAVWLDGRNFKTEGALKEMTLQFATYQNGKFQSEVLLDERVCDCCKTSAATTKDGIFVAYRDRSADEVRDVSYVRFSKGKWTKPKTLYPDGWKIAGCPVNGPEVAAEGDHLVVAWPTFADQKGRVWAIFSRDGGTTFGRPVRIDGGNPVGRVDVEWTSDGRAIVCWLEYQDNKTAQLLARTVSKEGKTAPPFVIAITSTARASGFPRMARFGKDIYFAWTEMETQSRIRFARYRE